MASEPRYPIREVSRLTGVNPVTLRAWQRRYGLLKPARTESGHRLYSEQDIEQIRQILHWLEKGISIGQVKGLLRDSDTPALSAAQSSNNWQQIQASLLHTACQLKISRLESELRELASLYPAELLLRKIIEPWLKQLAQLPSPDRDVIEQTSRALLLQLFIRLHTLQNGPSVNVLRSGNSSALSAALLQYELQGMELRSLDLGKSTPDQLPLINERLGSQLTVVLLGSGLNASWFKAHRSHWPELTFFVGEVGKLYQEQGWLCKPYAQSVSELGRKYSALFGLVAA